MIATDALLELTGDTLPADCQPVRYEAREYISRPFEVDVEFWTLDPSFDVLACLKKPLLLTLVDERSETRHIHGLVDTAALIGVDGGDVGKSERFRYQVRLVPGLASLAHRENCRIFQDKSLIDIVKEVMTDAGIIDNVEFQMLWSYEPREYCTQYKETELNFVHRLFEDEGIFYFFRHTPEGHKMIVTDGPESFVDADDAMPVVFAMAGGLTSLGKPLSDFMRTRSLRTSAVKMRDYDNEKPQQKPVAAQSATEALDIRYYEYPGNFTKAAMGSRRTMARLSQLRRDADVARGSSNAIGLRCGVPFTVENAAQGFLNGEFVVTQLVSRGVQTPGDNDNNYICKNEFHVIPRGNPFAPARTAKRPRIRGIQTAVVMGPAAEEEGIHVDKYARIKVRFMWDRVGQNDDKASCWLRTTQLITGGTMILPRQTWEVSVAFFNGDPDQPFCLGRVYNAEKAPPYALPAAAAAGAIKSMSTPGGGGHNEIKASDVGGSMGFSMSAQKDLNISSGNDRNETVAVDSKHSVTVNMKAEIGANETVEVGANQSIDCGAVLSNTVKGAQTISVGAVEDDNCTANYVEKVTGDRSYTVNASMTVICNGVKTNVDGDIKRTVGAVHLVGSVNTISDNIGGKLDETIGLVKILLVKGVASETVGGMRTQKSAAAEIHLIKANYELSCDGAVTQMVGGLHWQNIAGDYNVKAPMITLLGATGSFKGGGSELKLGGGPVVIKGKKIANKASGIITKMGTSLKMGSG